MPVEFSGPCFNWRNIEVSGDGFSGSNINRSRRRPNAKSCWSALLAGLDWAWPNRSPRTAGLSLLPSVAHLAAEGLRPPRLPPDGRIRTELVDINDPQAVQRLHAQLSGELLRRHLHCRRRKRQGSDAAGP